MRYPFDAIAPLLAHMTAREVAAIVGVQPDTVRAWRARHSTISEAHADLLATNLHVHPAEVWPEWHADITRQCDRCGDPFVPVINSARIRFCSPKCRRQAHDDTPERRAYFAEWQRKKYQENEAAREAKKKASRTYWNTAGKRARQRKKAA